MTADGIREGVAILLACAVCLVYQGPLIWLLCKLACRFCRWLLQLWLYRPSQNSIEPAAGARRSAFISHGVLDTTCTARVKTRGSLETSSCPIRAASRLSVAVILCAAK